MSAYFAMSEAAHWFSNGGPCHELLVQRLEARLNGERTVAIRALEWLGFRTLMRLPDYVMDMQSRPHDYVFMGLDLRTEEDYTSAE